MEVDAPLVTLETDKASMDVPASAAGRITEVLLKRGDKVSKGSLIARVEAGAAAARLPTRQRTAGGCAGGAGAGACAGACRNPGTTGARRARRRRRHGAHARAPGGA